MDGTLDDQYLTWLYAHVAPVQEKRASKTYWKLFKQLYNTEFTWLLSGDRNRAEEGRELRRHFADAQGLTVADTEWLDLGCSVLELLYHLADRLEFDLGEQFDIWFWDLVSNLGLISFTDANYDAETVDYILMHFMWRQYSPNGTGGAFPLKHANEDQRHVELWGQLNAYVIERF